MGVELETMHSKAREPTVLDFFVVICPNETNISFISAVEKLSTSPPTLVIVSIYNDTDNTSFLRTSSPISFT